LFSFLYVISFLSGHCWMCSQEEQQAVADRAKAEAAARLVAKQKAGKSSLVIDIKPWDDEAGPPPIVRSGVAGCSPGPSIDHSTVKCELKCGSIFADVHCSTIIFVLVLVVV